MYITYYFIDGFLQFRRPSHRDETRCHTEIMYELSRTYKRSEERQEKSRTTCCLPFHSHSTNALTTGRLFHSQPNLSVLTFTLHYEARYPYNSLPRSCYDRHVSACYKTVGQWVSHSARCIPTSMYAERHVCIGRRPMANLTT